VSSSWALAATAEINSIIFTKPINMCAQPAKRELNIDVAHRCVFNTLQIEKICQYYGQYGEDAKYVCDTSLGDGNLCWTIFYNRGKHPKFGNHYFGVRFDSYYSSFFICGADDVEKLIFGTIEVDNRLYYSRFKHDYFEINGHFIDGGRDYVRTNDGEIINLKIKNGIFVEY
jgi:hypothetical protein